MKKKLLAAIMAAVLVMGFAGGAWAVRQPHMRKALVLLLKAKKQLEAASPNKGGHRAAAIAAVDQAIMHTKEGIRYANKH
ncbi:MAG: hypothetical protein M0018_08920 [Nitrospiraceae bacterium]|nr:hypothetical protein [Nitrospiraceae bacterium]